jgi:hypothetical protein
MKQADTNTDFWITYVAQIFTCVLVTSELCRNEISSKDNKALLSCGKFVLGFLALHYEEDIGDQKRDCLLAGISSLLKMLFKLHLNSSESRSGSRKTM